MSHQQKRELTTTPESKLKEATRLYRKEQKANAARKESGGVKTDDFLVLVYDPGYKAMFSNDKGYAHVLIQAKTGWEFIHNAVESEPYYAEPVTICDKCGQETSEQGR